jgi:hypothetical protein
MTRNPSLWLAASPLPTNKAATRLSGTLAWLAVLFILCATRATGQGEIVVQFQGRLDSGRISFVSRYAGGMVVSEYEQTSDPVPRLSFAGSVETGRDSAKLSDLDLENAEIRADPRFGGYFSADLPCKAKSDCVSSQSSVYGNWPPRPDIGIACNSVNECQQFIEALKQAQAPKPQNPGNRTTQPRSAPAPVPQPGVQTRTPSANTSGPAATALQDILANIGWLSNNDGTGAGKSALDNLANSIKPGKRPAPAPPTKPTYAAFSQAGGFDANGAWGVGTGADLNSAIGMASGNCSAKARTGCDDQGYCMLKPGLWGAWASDLKVAGNSAFACNLKSEDEARNQAQAWCGAECKVFWSGAGQ